MLVICLPRNRMNALLLLGLLGLLPMDAIVSAFPASTNKKSTLTNNNPFLDAFQSLFPPPERNVLKRQLLQECRTNKNDQDKRQRIEQIIFQLAEFSPIQQTATSRSLQKLWKLEWTTEKEINFFIEKQITNGDITQLIEGSLLRNNIPWKNGGLSVSGELTTRSSASDVRTDFSFTTAVLDLGRWGIFKLPPVGQGWFDTIYLDEELRVDVNSRDDILICTPQRE
jgi:hypothetical protein